jgi:hypothetical protein
VRLNRHAFTATVATATVLGASLLIGMGRASAQPPPAKGVTVTIVNMTPTTPKYTSTPEPLSIELSLTNTTSAPLYDVNLDVERDVPIVRQDQLEQLIFHPASSTDRSSLSPLPAVELDTPLAPHEVRRITYQTTTSEMNDGEGICLCQSSGGGIYPIDFTAFAATEPAGESGQVGFGQTYLPSFRDNPKPVQVSWVWPLIDRPHRLVDGSLFVDDALAKSVGPNGRLDRALNVVERVASGVHLTLMIDPELIDELVAMSGPYQVEVNGTRTAGTGTEAAKSWLARLRSIITSTDVSLTPYADPDIDAVTRAGLTWSDNFGPLQLTRVQSALGIPADGDIAWPAGEHITSGALGQLLSRGTSEVLLSDAALPGARTKSPRPDALAPLPAEFGVPGAVAAVTDSVLQGFARPTLTQNASRTQTTLPLLVSDLAVRAAEEPDRSHYVVISADRYVDPSPAAAARTILATSHTVWSTSLTLNQAATTVRPVDHGQLVEPNPGDEVARSVIQQASDASTFVRSFSSIFSTDDATRLLGGLPAAIQRAESSAWRVNRAQGASFATGLAQQAGRWANGVSIVRPSSGSYTLASNDAPLFVTVVNTLPVDVNVRVGITTVNGVAGFRTDDVHVQRIPSGARVSLKIQAHVQRAGRFQVDATLRAPDGSALGQPVRLNIHCTALGAVGVIITAVACGVLVLALGFRVIRRIRSGPKRPNLDVPPRRPLPVKVRA